MTAIPLTDTVDVTFPVAEIFGPVLQGEGRLAGHPTHFIRFGGCNYKCAWCDSMHAVAPEAVRQLPRIGVNEILAQLSQLPRTGWITISGGNPAIHELRPLVEALHISGFKISIETQGTHAPEWLAHVDHVTISPKGPSALLSSVQYEKQRSQVQDLISVLYRGNMVNLGEKSHVVGRRHTDVDLKFPIFDDADFNYAVDFISSFPYLPVYFSVGTPPGAGTEEVLSRYRWLAEKTLRFPGLAYVKVLPQLHVLMYGHEKGK